MDAAEALSLVQLKMGNQPDYRYYMEVKARDIAQMKVGNQLDYRYSDMMFTDPEAPIRGDDGIWHFALFKAGKLAACLEVHSVFELCYPVVCPPDVEFERARIRIAVLRWLKKHGLAERFGPYFPGDYAYLAEEGDGDCGVR